MSDLTCAVCNHGESHHAHAGDVPANCTACPDDSIEWHAFEPTRFCAGTYTPEEERAAYEKALRGG